MEGELDFVGETEGVSSAVDDCVEVSDGESRAVGVGIGASVPDAV